MTGASLTISESTAFDTGAAARTQRLPRPPVLGQLHILHYFSGNSV